MQHTGKGYKAFVVATVALLACLALVREVYFFPMLDLIPNPDSAWLIYAAKRWLGGERLYVDILETNPPLIIWLSAIPVFLSENLGVSAFTLASLLVAAASLVSIFLVAKIAAKSELFKPQFLRTALILYTATAFFICTPAIYGQRELLFVILVFPYLIDSLCGCATKSFSLKIVIILLAAIGLAIKPFFMLLWGVNEIFAALHKKSWARLFAWHNWLIGSLQLIYFVAIYFITPSYISDIFPALLATYFTYNSPLENISNPFAITFAGLLLIIVLARLNKEKLLAALQIMLWFLACAGLMFIQRKDWLNHFYPMIFMAGLVLTIIIYTIVNEWWQMAKNGQNQDIGRCKFIALCLAVSVMFGGLYLTGVFTNNMLHKPSKLSAKLLTQIEEKATGKYVYPLVYNIQPSFPAIALSHGVFRGGFHHLWPLLGLVIKEQNGDNNERIFQTKEWFFNKIIDDFNNYPPTLVWVDLNVNLEKSADYVIEPQNRDIIGVLTRDVRFAKIWQNYEKYGEIESEEYDDEKSNKADIKPAEKPLTKKPERYALYIRKSERN